MRRTFSCHRPKAGEMSETAPHSTGYWLGRSWAWSDWKFTSGFAYHFSELWAELHQGAGRVRLPLFSRPGQHYRPTDRMVLARVATARIGECDAYEFFHGFDRSGSPTGHTTWPNGEPCLPAPALLPVVDQLQLRAAALLVVPDSAGRRSPICRRIRIFDAPEPWGPWTIAYSTESWDVGPGESAGLPTKWISSDGCSIRMVFSGDDHFSIRRGRCV